MIAADPDALYHADRFSTYSTADVTGTGRALAGITIPHVQQSQLNHHQRHQRCWGRSGGAIWRRTSLPVGGEST